MPTSDLRYHCLWGRSSGIYISRNFSKWFWSISILRAIAFKPIWPINHWFQLLQMFPVVKGSRNKSVHSVIWAPSPHPATVAQALPGELPSPFLSFTGLWSGASSFWLIVHFKAEKPDLLFSLSFTPKPSRPHRWAGHSRQSLQTAFNILLKARGQSFVKHSSLILLLHNWCQRETRRGNMTLF